MANLTYIGIHPVVLAYIVILSSIRKAVDAGERLDDLAIEIGTEACLRLGWSVEQIADIVHEPADEIAKIHEFYHFRMDRTNSITGEARTAVLDLIEAAVFAATRHSLICRVSLNGEHE